MESEELKSRISCFAEQHHALKNHFNIFYSGTNKSESETFAYIRTPKITPKFKMCVPIMSLNGEY